MKLAPKRPAGALAAAPKSKEQIKAARKEYWKKKFLGSAYTRGLILRVFF